MDLQTRIGPRIINARAFATAIGASVMCDPAREAMRDASRSYVRMELLHDAAGELIARVTGAQAGMATNSASAALALAAAACLTGSDLGRIEALPDTDGFPRRTIVVQQGHLIKYVHMLRIPGARIAPFGYLDGPGWTNPEQLRSAINADTAAVFYVAAFHKVYKGELPLPAIVEVARPLGVPVIVDAAYENDFRKWIALGADLVAYSGGKFLGGPSASGVLCGREDLIKAARKQDLGIGRAMKIGKEEIAGLMAALNAYAERDHAQYDAEMRARLTHLERGLASTPGVRTRQRFVDHTGSTAWLLELDLDQGVLGRSAGEVHAELAAGDPCVLVREYHAYRGILELDVTTLLDGQEAELLHFLKTAFSRRRQEAGGQGGGNA